MEFKQALFQAHLLYDIDIDEDDFEELGLICWNMIGNKQYRLYRFTADISCNNRTIQLPCNVDQLEAVTLNHEDWNYVTNDTPNGDFNSAYVESYIESRKCNTDPLYISGKYAKFERVGDTLIFDKDYGKVNILYKGFIVDDDGLPDINNKECLAIATYVASVVLFKKGISTNNNAIIQQSQLLEQKANRYIDNARVPEYFTQNELDRVLDAKSSWNRKSYNRSLKTMW